MKINIIELLTFFDELMAPTDEENGYYWFKSQCANNFSITFIVSIDKSCVSITVNDNSNRNIAGVSLQNCTEINVLDKRRKCLEILQEKGSGRCFISLLDGSILDYDQEVPLELP